MILGAVLTSYVAVHRGRLRKHGSNVLRAQTVVAVALLFSFVCDGALLAERSTSSSRGATAVILIATPARATSALAAGGRYRIRTQAPVNKRAAKHYSPTSHKSRLALFCYVPLAVNTSVDVSAAAFLCTGRSPPSSECCSSYSNPRV